MGGTYSRRVEYTGVPSMRDLEEVVPERRVKRLAVRIKVGRGSLRHGRAREK